MWSSKIVLDGVVNNSLDGIEQLHTAELLGVIFQSDFKFVDHVDATLKLCSQRLLLLKQLRDQGTARVWPVLSFRQ